MSAAESLARLLGPSPPSSVDELVPRSPSEWSALVDAALRHGVGPLLHRRLRSLGAGAAHPASIERLQIAYCHNALRQRTMRVELRGVLLALRHDGVRVVLLKGAHLADAVYGDPALRPMVDIDLLVASRDLAAVECRLREQGYSATASPATGTDYTIHQHTHPFEKRGAFPIEVHRGIVPTDAPFDVDLDGLWARAREVRVDGVEALVLSPDDLIRHLCVHAAYTHRFDVSLLALHDIAAALTQLRAEIDWPRLAATANRDGTSPFVFAALSLVAATFGVEIAPSTLRALDHAAGDLAVVRAARAALLARGAAELPIAHRTVRDADGLVPRVGAIVRAIWPPRDRMRSIYGLSSRSRAVYAYYAIRPLDLVRRRGRVVGAMLLRSPSLQPALAREEARRIIDRWIAASAGIPESG